MRAEGKNRKNGRNASDRQSPSPASHSPRPIIPPRGDYKTLLSFQKAEVVYDITFRFAHKFLAKGDRTIDQMIRSARSGKKNILEGSKAGTASKETEIKLTNVARASLEELRLDYEDFLRQRGLALWTRDDARRAELIARRPATADDVAQWAREVHDGQDGQHGPSGRAARQKSIESTKSTVSTYSEIAANGALALLAVACSLLNRQIASLETAFVEQGGFTERLYRVRNARRK